MWFEETVEYLVSGMSGLSVRQWIILLGAVTLLGAMCLRGFGSRKHY
jgi:hypothetical protein